MNATIANACHAYLEFNKRFATVRFQKLIEKDARLQRSLWTPTSTKNPAYPDVLFVEELIGPDTVNTMPPQTLAAFLDHGRVPSGLEKHLEAACRVFTDLVALGIFMDTVTSRLEEDGVKSFSDAFSVLLDTIDTRRKAVAKQ